MTYKVSSGTLSPYSLPFDAFNTGDPIELRVHIWYGKNRTVSLQSGEGRIMIDSVVWAQYIDVTDTLFVADRQVAIANAVWAQ